MLLVFTTFIHSYLLQKFELSREPSLDAVLLSASSMVICSPPTSFSVTYLSFPLIVHHFTFQCELGSLQFRSLTFYTYRFPYTVDFFQRLQVLLWFPWTSPYRKRFVNLLVFSRSFITALQNSLYVAVCIFDSTTWAHFHDALTTSSHR